MKKYILYGFVLYAAFSMYSFSTGFGNPATGAPGESGASCGQGGCHASGAFSPELSFTMTDSNGNLVTTYDPGSQYQISIKVNHTGLPSGYGFQMVCLDGDGEPANSFVDLPSGVQEIDRLDRQYVGHSTPSPVDSITVTWIASQSTEHTFYAGANAVNGNSSPTGDGSAQGSFTVTQNSSSTTELATFNLQVFPNPTTDIINVPTEIAVKEMQLFDLTGKNIQSSNTNSMNIAQLESGQYLIRVLDTENKTYSEQIQKI